MGPRAYDEAMKRRIVIESNDDWCWPNEVLNVFAEALDRGAKESVDGHLKLSARYRIAAETLKKLSEVAPPGLDWGALAQLDSGRRTEIHHHHSPPVVYNPPASPPEIPLPLHTIGQLFDRWFGRSGR